MAVSLQVLLAGRWQFDMYEPAFAAALERQGATVRRLAWHQHVRRALGRVQEKWNLMGPALASINRDIVRAAIDSKPDVLFVWRGSVVDSKTIEQVGAETGALLVSYNNDDPFGAEQQRASWQYRRTWMRYLEAVPAYDIHFVYRPVNVAEIQRAGARDVHVLKPYFVPDLHHPMCLTAEERQAFAATAVFAGHYENDGRADCIRTLVNAGILVRIFGGPEWTRRLPDLAGRIPPISVASGLDYARALNGARFALCFLSKFNRDTYTRRCFEIPACGALLVSERTSDLQAMFREDEEAVFFSSPAELLDKIRGLLANPERAARIARAGTARVHRDGHTVDDRAREWLETVDSHLRRRDTVR